MGIEYRNTKFVNLFGDPDRPIYGDELVVPASPSPTPSATLTPTPTITPTLTPTPTPSATPPPQGYAEANAYLSAVVGAGGTGITSSVSAATRTFFSELFTYNLWDKLGAIYPFIGGTADAHKFNGKNPQDTDAAFRITWYGGMGHNGNGIAPNGSNAFGNTHFTPADNSSLSAGTEGHIGIYLRTTGTSKTFAAEVGVGYYNVAYTLVAGLPNYGSAPDNVGGIFSDTNIGSGISGLTAGVVLHSKTGTSTGDAVMYSNGGAIGTLNNGSQASLLTWPVTIGALRLGQGSGAPDGDGGGIYSYTDRAMSMVFLGIEGLTASEVIALTNIIDDYQVALGRNVI